MRVYINNVTKEVDFDEKYTRHVIYSNSGIYCNIKNKLTQMLYEDSSEYINYKDYNLYIDKSTESFGDVIQHLPYDHLYCSEQYEKKNIGYDVYYVKCNYFDQTSYYFELSSISELQLDTIISFLSI
jgi:hypothetical protein